MQINKEDIVSKECRFAVYCPPQNGGRDDLHVVKEIVHLKDGTAVPRLNMITNFKRDFYVTKKGMQNHQQKKEWEKLEHLNKFKTTQSQLCNSIAKAIEEPWRRDSLRRLCVNPYVYGADILSTAVIKKQYQYKYPKIQTPYLVSVLDTESDVVNDGFDIIMCTVTCKNKVFTAVLKSFVEGRYNPIEEMRQRLHKYLGKFVEERKIEWEVILVDTPAQTVVESMKRLHEWKPDIVAIWNIDHDIPEMLKALDKEGIDPKDVFSDPNVPNEFKFFKYAQDNPQKVTASGKSSPKKFEALWHTVFCPASFYFIDAMCTYRQIRAAEGEEQKYGLDYILDKEFANKPEIRKLSFKEADGMSRVDKHYFMQKNYPFEYVIYNVFDCMSMELLDEKTRDLSITLPMFSEHSDFQNFNSQPRRLVDKIHYFALENGYVIATTSSDMKEEDDDETIDMKGWIVTLPAHLLMPSNVNVIEEGGGLRHNFFTQMADLDVSASYPNGGASFNISKKTTCKEILSVAGIPEIVQRQQGINLSGGPTNAVEVATELLGLPTMDVMLDSFRTHLILGRTINAG